RTPPLPDATARRRPRAGPRRPASRSRSKELLLSRRRGPDVRAPEFRDRAAPRRALDEPELEQIGLVDVLDRLLFLAERRRKRRESHRSAVELLHDRAQQLACLAIESFLVDLEQRQRLPRVLRCDRPLVTHLRDVAHAPEDPVGDARRPPRAPRNLLGGLLGDLDAENTRRAVNDRAELPRVVIVEPEGKAEPVAQRRREQAGARRRADERERRQVERQCARGRALTYHDVDAEVLERRIE